MAKEGLFYDYERDSKLEVGEGILIFENGSHKKLSKREVTSLSKGKDIKSDKKKRNEHSVRKIRRNASRS